MKSKIAMAVEKSMMSVNPSATRKDQSIIDAIKNIGVRELILARTLARLPTKRGLARDTRGVDRAVERIKADTKMALLATGKTLSRTGKVSMTVTDDVTPKTLMTDTTSRYDAEIRTRKGRVGIIAIETIGANIIAGVREILMMRQAHAVSIADGLLMIINLVLYPLILWFSRRLATLSRLDREWMKNMGHDLVVRTSVTTATGARSSDRHAWTMRRRNSLQLSQVIVVLILKMMPSFHRLDPIKSSIMTTRVTRTCSSNTVTKRSNFAKRRRRDRSSWTLSVKSIRWLHLVIQRSNLLSQRSLSKNSKRQTQLRLTKLIRKLRVRALS